MKSVGSTLGGLKDNVLGLVSLPTLGRVVDMPVYLVHNSSEADDYFFIFDFDRALFAQQFRASFAKQFDAARAALTEEKKDGGWFTWLNDIRVFAAERDFSAFAANVVLLVGLNAGRMVLSQILPRGLWRGKSEERKLEESIETTKAKVDTALKGVQLVLHHELYNHPYKGAAPEPAKGAVFDDWPLPPYVREHIADRTSGAFW